MMTRWSVPREWAGETAFIVGGGPSVSKQPVDRLRGRRVIAINSSYELVPWADVLFFGDARWFREIHHQQFIAGFKGRVVTVAVNITRSPKVLLLEKVKPPGLSDKPDAVTMLHTSMTGAINVAAHFGAARICLLGADGRADGKRTHHHSPHRWPVRPGAWDLQRDELRTTMKPLKKRGIKVVNCSPGSAWDLWPIMSLDEFLHAESDVHHPKHPQFGSSFILSAGT